MCCIETYTLINEKEEKKDCKKKKKKKKKIQLPQSVRTISYIAAITCPMKS